VAGADDGSRELGGMLATDGGLLFTGSCGEFIALDQDNGKTLWKFKTGSSVTRRHHLHAQRPAIRDGSSGRGGASPAAW